MIDSNLVYGFKQDYLYVLNGLGRPFWSGAATNAVVIEADAFKESDVIYRALSSRGHHDDMLQTAELVSEPFHVMIITFPLNSPLLYL